MPQTRIGFLLGRPTQFDAPFFRYAHSTGRAALSVLYVDAGDGSGVHDSELGRRVDWGMDLLSGYPNQVLPRHGRLAWLRNELRRDRYDWLAINGYTAWPYLAALAAARQRGVRTALRMDSVLFNAGGWRRRFMKRAIVSGLAIAFDRFLATGSLARQYLEHFGISPARIALFPYGVDADYFAVRSREARVQRAALRRRYGVPEHAKVLLVVAKLNDREAPWDLLGALEGLRHRDLWTVLVGDGPQRAALQAQVTSRALERVAFTGYVPYPQLPGCYAMADVFVHAAKDEPWGVSVHEALACGLPVVASSRVGAAADLILPGRNGHVYPWGDAAALRERLLATIDALDWAEFARANAEVLARWSYPAAWNGIVEACA